MGFELQIRERTLTDLVARVSQRHLFERCFPPLGNGTHYIDRVDVVAREVRTIGDDGVVRILVPVDVHTVSRQDVLTSPNRTPPTTTSRARITFELRTSDVTTIELGCAEVTLGHVGEAIGVPLDSFETTICALIGTPVTANVGPFLDSLQLHPTSARVDAAPRAVSIRFDPVTEPANHLFGDHDLGVFLDADTIVRFVREQTGIGRIDDVPLASVDVTWHPRGDTPRVRISADGRIPTDPFGALAALAGITLPTTMRVKMTVECALDLTPQGRLRVDGHYQLHVDLGATIPAFVDREARALVALHIQGHLRRQGIQLDGERGFWWEVPLGDLRLGGAGFDYTSARASTAGMTLGGQVRLPAAPDTSWRFDPELKEPEVGGSGAFGPPSYSVEWCFMAWGLLHEDQKARLLAAHAAGARVRGEVTSTPYKSGAACKAELVRGSAVAPYLTDVGGAVRVSLPAAVAATIRESVQILLRTARGVRLVDLGTPAEVSDDAQVDFYCLDPVEGIVEGKLFGYDTDPLTGEPLRPLRWRDDDDDDIGKDWLGHDLQLYVERYDTVAVQVVRLSDLGPGELVQVELGDNRALVTAGADGRVLVPLALHLHESRTAQLYRLGRSDLPTLDLVGSVAYRFEATLPSGKESRLVRADGGGVHVVTDQGDRTDVYELHRTGLRHRDAPVPEHHQAVGPTDYDDLDPEMWLVDPDAIMPVPGFADAPVAIALADDGSKLVVDRHDPAAPRIAGLYQGPLGPAALVDDWMLLEGTSHNTILSRLDAG